MQEELITFETAKLAKQKGFNIEALNFYTKPKSKMFGIDEHGRSYSAHNTPKKLYTIGKDAALNIESVYPAPTQSLLQKWLREEHKFHVEVFINDSSINKLEEYTYNISLPRIKEDEVNWKYDLTICNTYEEALETALYQALKLIKTI